MKITRLAAIVLAAIAVAGCEGGGVDLAVETTDNSVDNSTNGGGGGGGTNPCASYTPPSSNEVRIGTFDGTNCVYSAAFVGKTNPLLVDLTIPFISGVHIFQDSLFVGQDVEAGAAPAAGEGPTLTIAAGNRLAFSNSADYVLINRGSQIFAEGSPTAPIVFTAFSDAVSDTAGANDVSLWGGIVINGNGITNNCNDAERAADQCHVVSEGQPSHYGGDNNQENSGVLRYVIVKHTGFEVAPNDELNGITFNAVGSGTTVESIEAYSTYDDGFEFFGGAVNVSKAIVLYARDDSLDFSDGYVGTISEALIIHYETDGNRCIEGDNIAEARGSAEPLDTQPQSNPTFRNLTCITSNGDQSAGQGTHGDSEGAIARFGARMHIEDSIFYSGYGFVEGALPSNECLEFENATSAVTGVKDISNDLAAAGQSTMKGSLIACEEPVTDAAANGDSFEQWVLGANPSANGANYSFNTGNAIIKTAPNAASVLDPESFYTASSFTDDLGNPVTVTPVNTDTCDDCPKVGAVLADGDWTTPWAYGLREENADEALWITVPPSP